MAATRAPKAHADEIWAVAWAENGIIATGSIDERVKFWAEGSGEKGERQLLETRVCDGNTLGVCGIAFDRAGTMLAAASLDSHIRVYSSAEGRMLRDIDAGPVEAWGVAWHPTLPRLATGSAGGNVNLWRAEADATGEEDQTGTCFGGGKFVMSVAFSPDGLFVACGASDGTASVFDAEKGEILHKLEAHALPIRSITFSPDSRVLYTASDDGRVNVFDVSSREKGSAALIASMTGHTAWVLSVSASRDGTRVATGSSDKTVKLWDARRRECVSTIVGHTDQVWGVAYNKDGTRLATAGSDGMLQTVATS